MESSVKKGQLLGGISPKLQRNDQILLKISITCRILVVKNYPGDLKEFSRNCPCPNNSDRSKIW